MSTRRRFPKPRESELFGNEPGAFTGAPTRKGERASSTGRRRHDLSDEIGESRRCPGEALRVVQYKITERSAATVSAPSIFVWISH